MRTIPLSRLMVALALIAGASPASAAVTLRGIVPEDGPRTGWFERYTETAPGPRADRQGHADLQGRRRRGARPVAPRRRHPRHRRHAAPRSRSRRPSACAIAIRNRPSACSRRCASTINNFNGRVEVRTIYPRRGIVRQQHLGQRRLRHLGAGRRERGAQVDLRRHQRHERAKAKCAPKPSAATSTSAPRRTSRWPRRFPATSRRATSARQTTLVLEHRQRHGDRHRACKVRALEAGSVSGDVRLVGSEVERLEAKSVSGQHRIRCAAHQGRTLRVHLALRQRAGRAVGQHRLRARRRHLQRQRPVGRAGHAARDRPERPAPRDRRGSNRAIRGSYGDASAFLSVRSHSGSVVITKK